MQTPLFSSKIFLKMIGRPLSDDMEKHLAENRRRADAFFDEKIKARFVDEAIARGRDEIEKFVSGAYSR